ncbi:hypothetical protein AVEN_3738-1 [Araneus ventricosus]|uniref:Nucleic-acid-binding protein from transposon X-element n=1 Tax=Araneus ventricosus TaxID=182803 RepID=A0A4Y2TIV1_ARAVE|nr:hypothetical protein AVEN_3738-1 [Araneus ventricosus]
MCFKCSDFYHSARNSHRKPRCIKCNEEHETRNCPIKTKIEKPTCINCKQIGHLASWQGCPNYPNINIKKSPTYAPKLKLNLNRKEKPTEIPKIAPNKQDLNDKFSDFERNFNALQIINNAFKRFPNLIQISEQIKVAENDPEIFNLLSKITKI